MKSQYLGKIVFFFVACFFLQQAFALSASFPKDDSVITAQFQAKLQSDPALARLSLDISTRSQVLSIRGMVPSKREAKRLITLAESIPGVQDVDVSSLSLTKGSLSADEKLASMVLGLYIREGLMVPSVQIQVLKGTVYLSGSMNDASQAATAVQLAKSIPGVQDVKSTITVQNP